MNVQTSIVLENGQRLPVSLWDEPERDGIWFANVASFVAARGGEGLETIGPFASERDARAWLFGCVEREFGMLREVRREVTSGGDRAPAPCPR